MILDNLTGYEIFYLTAHLRFSILMTHLPEISE